MTAISSDNISYYPECATCFGTSIKQSSSTGIKMWQKRSTIRI